VISSKEYPEIEGCNQTSLSDCSAWRSLLLSSIFDVMNQVVLGSWPSVHAAYQASEENIGVPITSVYNKINGTEPNVSAQLARYVVEKAEPVIQELVGTTGGPFLGF
jgi:hypothetical protein